MTVLLLLEGVEKRGLAVSINSKRLANGTCCLLIHCLD